MSISYIMDIDLYDCVMSVLMSEYLDKEGYSLLDRSENTCTQVITQLAELLLLSFKSITIGGKGEGSSLPESSDCDFMRVLDGFRVSEEYNLPFSGIDKDGMIHICMKRSKTFPGFCKLELSKNCNDKLQKRLRTLRTTQTFQEIIASVIKQENSLLISSKLIKDNLTITGLVPPVVKNDHVDYVSSFEFKIWPQEAKVWKKRRRNHNWPSTELLDRLEKECACFVVPKGNTSSVDFEVEWSLSFVEIERELIRDMSDTQFKCYICLKRIKKVFLNYICPCFEKISTYQVKNIMFWICETISENEWETFNIFQCVRLCLKKLQNCIWQGYNAHYFIPEMNLWRSVTLSVSEKRKAINFLIAYNDKPVIAKSMLRVSKLITSDLNMRTILSLYTYEDRCSTLMDYGSKCLKETHIEHLYEEMISRFPETKTVSPCKAITLAKVYLSELLLYNDLKHSKNIDKYRLSTAIKHTTVDGIIGEMEIGYKIDYLIASLNIAFVYNFFKRYSDVRKELKPKLLNESWKLFQYKRVLYYLVLNSAEIRRVTDDVSDLIEDKQNVVLVFIFRVSETEILPFPMKLQNCLFENLRIRFEVFSPIIAYYLLFTSEHYLGFKRDSEATRKLLVSAVLNSKFHESYFFHLYLVGYSFYVPGDMKEAYNWFARSAVQTRRRRLNAAVYQIAIMINDEIQRRK